MSVSFVKLFTTITDSSVWALPDAVRVIWITLLSMANSRGTVHASVVGIANRARKSIEEVEAALMIFMAPDPYSRTKVLEGRRIVEIDGGWRLVNYEMHRNAVSAEAVRETKRVSAEKRRQLQQDGPKLNDPSTEVDISRQTSIVCSVSLSGSGSGSGSDPDLTQARARDRQAPTPAQGQPLVWFTLDDWVEPDGLEDEAVSAGVPREFYRTQLETLRNTTIGGKGGVRDRAKYVRGLFGKWKTWAETGAYQRTRKDAPNQPNCGLTGYENATVIE